MSGSVAEGVPLTVDDDLAKAVDFAKDADGLVPAIVQDAVDGTVLTVAYMDAEALRHTRCSQTEDHREAAAAFVEKRAPLFKGR